MGLRILFALMVVCVACGRRDEKEDEQPPEPVCIQDAEEQPSCEGDYLVDCDPEKPYPICVYDENETEGTARCTGALGDLNFLPPYYYPECVPAN